MCVFASDAFDVGITRRGVSDRVNTKAAFGENAAFADGRLMKEIASRVRSTPLDFDIET
jgi:hypothetical protein